MTGAACADYRAAVESLWIPNRDAKEGSPAWDACSPLLRLAGALTLLLKPNVVVETGVARGYSSRTILAVMERNGSGRLYSVDLPPLEVKEDEFVGQAIPLEFRHRWDLTIGPSRQVLGSLVRRVAPVDLSLHDADHTYPSQLLEYRTVWPYLRPGGVLLSDDVGNRAFLDFADEVAAPAFLVPRHGNTAIGLMQKACC